MLAEGMLLDDGEPFDAVMERCAGIEARANTVRIPCRRLLDLA